MSDWPVPSASASHEMELIATTALAGAAASIGFSGIDTTYRFFELVGWFLKDANAGQIGVTLNGDTTGVYNVQRIHADGATLGSARNLALNSFLCDIYQNIDASTVSSLSMTIEKPLASERATAKHLFSYISTAIILETSAFDWNNTAALISSIQVKVLSNNLAIGSRVSLGGARVD